MPNLLRILLANLGLLAGCAKTKPLSSGQFTGECAAALRAARPDWVVNTTRDLELAVSVAGKDPATSFLNNAYDVYRQNPAALQDVISRYVAAGIDTVEGIKDGVDRTRIVPVIKDRPWLAETRNSSAERGTNKPAEHVFEDFSADLVILYAEDSPKHIRYLTPKDLELGKIDRAELRSLAAANLQRLLPKIERHGSGGFFMLTAGGDYEACLLLFDSIWDDLKPDVQGEIVVAIPSRDLLLVTGSRFPLGLEKMRRLVRETTANGSYRLTPQLFVRRHGRFEAFLE